MRAFTSILQNVHFLKSCCHFTWITIDISSHRLPASVCASKTPCMPRVTCGRNNVKNKRIWRCRGLNPGPFTCKANALPLSYIPSSSRRLWTEHVIICMHACWPQTYMSRGAHTGPCTYWLHSTNQIQRRHTCSTFNSAYNQLYLMLTVLITPAGF